MRHPASARTRLLICGLSGLLVGLMFEHIFKAHYAPLIGWNAAALVYMTSVLFSVINLDGATTKRLAKRENPGRAASDIILIIGSLTSLVAVTILIFQAPHLAGGARTYNTVLALASISIAWMLIHTSFMLRYARVYYDKTDGGVDFNQVGLPAYGDFAYLALTIGMAYQVSDTNITSTAMRRTVMHHSLLSYVFGTIIIATTIGALSGLI